MTTKTINSILVLGDSLSRGVVFDQSKGRYCFLKDCFVNKISREIIPHIYNTSKFGADVEYGIALLEKKVSETDADVVMLEFGGNDCDFRWEEIAADPLQNHKPRTPLDVFSLTLRQAVEIIRSMGKTPVLMTLPPLNAPNYFQWFTGGDTHKAEQILRWLGEVGRIYWWHECYSAQILKVGRETGAHVIDVRSDFLETEDYRELMCVDGIHPNEAGHTLIARCVERFIARNAGYLFCRKAPLPV